MDGPIDVIAECKPPFSWLVLYSRDKTDKPWEELLPKQDTSERIAAIICLYGPNWRKTKEGVLVQLIEEEDKEKLQENGDEDGTIFVRRICRVLATGTLGYDHFSWSAREAHNWYVASRHVNWCID